MLEIRHWWPDIENSEVDAINAYSSYELLILRRMVNVVGGGTEISEGDLLQSVPKDKIKKLKKAVENLQKKKILLPVPKIGGLIVYRVHPEIYTEPLKKFLEIVRTCKDLKDALIFENINILRKSDLLEKTFYDIFKKNEHGLLLEILPSEELSCLNNELGIIVKLKFICKKCYNYIFLDFCFLDPRDFHKSMETWNCNCGTTYTCMATGRIY